MRDRTANAFRWPFIPGGDIRQLQRDVAHVGPGRNGEGYRRVIAESCSVDGRSNQVIIAIGHGTQTERPVERIRQRLENHAVDRRIFGVRLLAETMMTAPAGNDNVVPISTMRPLMASIPTVTSPAWRVGKRRYEFSPCRTTESQPLNSILISAVWPTSRLMAPPAMRPGGDHADTP